MTTTPADTIKHGTYGGYQAHRKRARKGLPGGEPCTPCRIAGRAYMDRHRNGGRFTVAPGPGPEHSTACTGGDGRHQNGIPGDADAPTGLVRHLYAVHGPTTTCGHDDPTIAVRTEAGEVLSCRRCALRVVDGRTGVTYLEGLPGRGSLPDPGGDAA
jgi:hypothetical protein